MSKINTKHSPKPEPDAPKKGPSVRGVHTGLPRAPLDWRERTARLLARPGLDPHDADKLRAWIAWRTLPPRYWPMVLEIAARIGGE